MNFDKFPNELKYKILTFLPHVTFKDLYDITPTSSEWKPILARILYRHIVIASHSEYTSEGYRVTLLELEKLASREIKVHVHRLEIVLDYYYVDTIFDRFLEAMMGKYSRFFASIPQITFDGDLTGLKKTLPGIRSNNVTELKLDLTLQNFSTSWYPLPPKLEVLTCCGDESRVDLIQIPKSLRTISVVDNIYDVYEVDISILFPSEFDMDGSFNHELPKKFPNTLTSLSLTSYNMRGKTFPEKLAFLSLYRCYFELSEIINSRWPRNLKELRLEENYIEDLSGIFFPPSLKILLLKDCRIKSFKSAKFPDLLQSLNIEKNPFLDLDGVTFPNLKTLKIHNSKLISLSGVHFPETLENLTVSFKEIEWNEAELLNSDRKLSGSLENEKFTFPPQLEELKLSLNEEAKYAKLQLPKSLRKLFLKGGKSSNFDWELPSLVELHLEDFDGPVEVPHTVTRLELLPKEDEVKELKLHEGIRYLQVGSHLTHYPRSLAELDILRFKDEVLNLELPNLTKLELFKYPGPKVCMPNFPPKLKFLEGSFDIETQKRFDSLQR